ncbi:MAG: general secretion pathway protein GspB [Arenicella sp.]|jgi:hypothetical protein|nr:general secretion pathway protein GspB [Arenicella sp.]HAU67910.1 hypothetical protein [Gammaproteobacteria bacterium]
MSTILEALKKSERERKLSDIPTLSDMPAIEEPSPFKWIGLTIVGLFAVSLLAAFIVMTLTSADTSTVAGAKVVSVQESAATASLSVLSYSENPEQRFAIINDKLVREGDFLATGIKIEQILTDRVTLIVKGDRMSLKP